MKRILQISLLMITAFMGRSVNAATYTVENLTTNPQTIFFAHSPGGKISNTLTLAPGDKKSGSFANVFYINFNGTTYLPGTVANSGGFSSFAGYMKDGKYFMGLLGRPVSEQEKNDFTDTPQSKYALLSLEMTQDFKIVPVDGKPVLMGEEQYKAWKK